MEVFSVRMIEKTFDDTLKHALKCGYRTEGMYNRGVFEIDVRCDHMWEVFCRWFWEYNHFGIDCEDGNVVSMKSVYDKDSGIFKMRIHLNEMIDYIYTCTPAHLRKEIPEHIKDAKEIEGIVRDFLIDDTLGRQEYYHDAFKRGMMMIFDKENGFNTNKINMIRDKVMDGVVVHVVYKQNKGWEDGIGLYTLNGFNQDQLKYIACDILGDDSYDGWNIVEVYKNKEGYYHVGLEVKEKVGLNKKGIEELKRIYDTSYGWIGK